MSVLKQFWEENRVALIPGIIGGFIYHHAFLKEKLRDGGRRLQSLKLCYQKVVKEDVEVIICVIRQQSPSDAKDPLSDDEEEKDVHSDEEIKNDFYLALPVAHRVLNSKSQFVVHQPSIREKTKDGYFCNSCSTHTDVFCHSLTYDYDLCENCYRQEEEDGIVDKYRDNMFTGKEYFGWNTYDVSDDVEVLEIKNWHNLSSEPTNNPTK